MIYINSYPKSGFGNKLMDYIQLRQISDKLSCDFYSPSFIKSDLIQFGKKSFNFFLKNKLVVDSQLIRLIDPQNFVSYLKKVICDGYKVEIKTPLLGEFFFDFLYKSPGNYIDIKLIKRPIKICGIHFRGGDFAAWNPKAIMPLKYYKDSIDFIIANENKVIFNLFSDDRSNISFKAIKNYLIERNYKFNDCAKKNYLEEFIIMADSDFLISSPSTFCIMAGCTGKTKKIIYSNDWINYTLERKDKFWVDLNKTKNLYYKIWKLI